ncbi:hypothetical protein E3U43_002717 [Larimichthys crocea]|uniref:Uncharacterized protein n=1 Tax=Larimichthys crocea TaxID=215358 RepID=A0ACD3QU94_LARCR|nr:hypothetical protein E3U43_002717 [Larimichthys crocea]
MSDHVTYEQCEMNPTDDSGYEADGLELSIHTSVTRIEYYSSFEYSLKWGGTMYPRRSSRLSKGSTKSPKRSPSPNKDVIQRKLSGKRPKAGQRKTKAVNNIVDADEGNIRDLIDIINSPNDVKHVAEEEEEDGGELLKVVDEGVDYSDEDSVISSVASGPSLKWRPSPKKHRPLQGVCSACRKLYQKAKKMKAPLKNKLLDNNPKSLTCDQWVLLKKWTPRRLPNSRGKLLAHVQLVSKRLMKNGAKQTEQCVEPSTCWRQHAFLQRNLRQNMKAPVKNQRKKNRRKRTRDDSQGPRVAKQQRLNSSNRRQNISMDCTDDDDDLLPASVHSSSPGFEESKEHEADDSADTHLTFELIPTSVSLETTKPRRVSPRRKTPEKTRGFRDLLAQLRGNSSMIVRETR